MEIKDLLAMYKYDADKVPIIRGSALCALQGKDKAIGHDAIMQLAEALDTTIPEPKRLVDADFLMPIESIFSVKGRGTVVTGRIERGRVKVGDELEILGIRAPQKTVCTGVEMFKKMLDSGDAGDVVGVLLRGTKREDVERGQVLAKPGSLKVQRRFEAEVYVLTKDEGGRHTPFFKNYRPQFFFRTADITGTVSLPKGVEMVMPGDNATITIELISDAVVEPGMRFALREGGRTVGAGVITKLLPNLTPEEVKAREASEKAEKDAAKAAKKDGKSA